jgi:hypothetical protein
LLDEQLSGMAAAVEAGQALFVDDGELARLATDVPDLRLRLGIGETVVFGGTGFSLVKVQMQVRLAASISFKGGGGGGCQGPRGAGGRGPPPPPGPGGGGRGGGGGGAGADVYIHQGPQNNPSAPSRTPTFTQPSRTCPLPGMPGPAAHRWPCHCPRPPPRSGRAW